MSKLVSSMSHEFGRSPIKSDMDGSFNSPIKEVVEVTDSTPVKTPPSPKEIKIPVSFWLVFDKRYLYCLSLDSIFC